MFQRIEICTFNFNLCKWQLKAIAFQLLQKEVPFLHFMGQLEKQNFIACRGEQFSVIWAHSETSWSPSCFICITLFFDHKCNQWIFLRYFIFLVNCMHHEIKSIVVTIIFLMGFPFLYSIFCSYHIENLPKLSDGPSLELQQFWHSHKSSKKKKKSIIFHFLGASESSLVSQKKLLSCKAKASLWRMSSLWKHRQIQKSILQGKAQRIKFKVFVVFCWLVA